MDIGKTFARIVIDGKAYLVSRDASVEGMMKERGFNKVLRRLFLLDENGTDVKLCIVFYLGILAAHSWDSNEESAYGSQETLEFSFANVLPHLRLDLTASFQAFENSRNCLAIEFCDKEEGLEEEKSTYHINLKDGFFKTSQKIVFRTGVNRAQARREILQLLLNHFNENPVTFMSLENLQSSIPLTTKDLLSNLYLLKEEDKVDFVTAPADPQKIISVKIKAPGVRELENKPIHEVKLPQMVKNVYGTNIESTTYGANSPITVNIDEIETVFESLQKEINNSTDIKEKEQVIKDVQELKEEIKSNKNPAKAKELLTKIQNSTEWVYKKIVSNPIISGIIADLLMRVAENKEIIK